MDHPRVSVGTRARARGGARPLFGRSLTASQLIALDCLVAAGYVGLLLTLLHTGTEPAPLRGDLPALLADVLVLATGLPLAVRRLWPRTVLAVVLAMSAAALLLDVVKDPFMAVAYALYPVALARPGQRWVPAAAAALLGLTGLIATQPSTPYLYWWLRGPGLILFGWALIGVSWALGTAVRERRGYAVRAAAQLADRAVTEERLRIARELHDIVAHSVGVIAVKAGVANHVVRTRPEEAGEALRVIEATSRDALREMRQLLGVLRSEEPVTDQRPGDLSPVPGPAGLAALVRNATTAGLRVRMDADGLDDLPEAMGLTVYRVVQEALTNAVKHAAPADCRVEIRRDARGVRIDVRDDGSGAADASQEPGQGHGLIGMRERIAVYGGDFRAGPRPDGGFAVSAVLPWGTA